MILYFWAFFIDFILFYFSYFFFHVLLDCEFFFGNEGGYERVQRGRATPGSLSPSRYIGLLLLFRILCGKLSPSDSRTPLTHPHTQLLLWGFSKIIVYHYLDLQRVLTFVLLKFF